MRMLLCLLRFVGGVPGYLLYVYMKAFMNVKYYHSTCHFHRVYRQQSHLCSQAPVLYVAQFVLWLNRVPVILSKQCLYTLYITSAVNPGYQHCFRTANPFKPHLNTCGGFSATATRTVIDDDIMPRIQWLNVWTCVWDCNKSSTCVLLEIVSLKNYRKSIIFVKTLTNNVFLYSLSIVINWHTACNWMVHVTFLMHVWKWYCLLL
jgi:hypothetical protein